MFVPDEAAVAGAVFVGERMRFAQRLSCMIRKAFSTGLNAGQLGGSGMSVMFGRHDQAGRAMPAGLVEQDYGMCSGCDVEGDLLKMYAHRFAVTPEHDDAGGFA